MARFYNQWAGNPAGTPEDPARCIAEVYDSVSCRFYQCARKRNQEEYCKTHHPAAQSARDAKRNARYAQEVLEMRINAARRQVADAALKAYRQEASFDDLERAVAALQSLLDKLK